ncbi:uncharacterized protein LOC142101118 [Mixophyes fleayi]|uniref:uncharacterized protein LOC142101118 n=1 Tax=Mixophyes fleayi TaxID=3061075 RepID=UPI003F4D9F2A
MLRCTMAQLPLLFLVLPLLVLSCAATDGCPVIFVSNVTDDCRAICGNVTYDINTDCLLAKQANGGGYCVTILHNLAACNGTWEYTDGSGHITTENVTSEEALQRCLPPTNSSHTAVSVTEAQRRCLPPINCPPTAVTVTVPCGGNDSSSTMGTVIGITVAFVLVAIAGVVVWVVLDRIRFPCGREYRGVTQTDPTQQTTSV